MPSRWPLFPPHQAAFDETWHKLHFGVFRDRVTLYLDCERTTEVPLDPFGPIDINGNIYIAKQQNSARTVPVSAALRAARNEIL